MAFDTLLQQCDETNTGVHGSTCNNSFNPMLLASCLITILYSIGFPESGAFLVQIIQRIIFLSLYWWVSAKIVIFLCGLGKLSWNTLTASELLVNPELLSVLQDKLIDSFRAATPLQPITYYLPNHALAFESWENVWNTMYFSLFHLSSLFIHTHF